MALETVLDLDEMVVCVGHKPPFFSIKDTKPLFLCEEDIGVPNSWVFGKEYPDLMSYGYTLSEYSALFALCRRMRNEGIVPSRIILTQYRKIVANRKIGRPAKNMKYVNTISGDELMIGKSDLEPLAGNLLVSKPLDLKERVIDQFSADHVLRDLMAFMVDSIDGGVIDNPATNAIIKHKYLIPAPTLGCYEGNTFVEIFSILEHAAYYFIGRSYVPRENYQRRVLGFCLERLHSFILLERLGFPNEDHESFGYQVVMSDSDMVKTTI